MHKTLNILFCMAFCTMLVDCTATLENIPASNEVVNGFNVTWRINVTDSQKEVIREILNDMQYVEGATFLMGATQEQEPYARENEKPAHYVRLSNYYIGRNEVSISQLELILGKDFSAFEKKHGAPQYTWADWKKILDLIYEYSGVIVDFPTEAQWEYAARGGNKSKGFIYSGGSTLEDAEFVENELGLFGMVRGHSEWCKDAYNDYSGFPLEINPYSVQGQGHVVRGGNEKSVEKVKNYYGTRFSSQEEFFNIYKDARSCRVSARSYSDDSYAYLGVYISCRFVININQE